MSLSDSAVLEPVPEELKSDSVFDFLYHDARRVGSFLSQFDDAGHLQQIKQTETAGKSASNKVNTGGEGGVPLLAKAKGGVERVWGHDGREGAERVYDPLWVNARTLLDYLDGQGMINRDIASARIGDFVQISGSLGIVDLAMFKDIWGLAGVKAAILEGAKSNIEEGQNRHQRRAQGKSDHPAAKLEKEVSGALEVMSLLPHGLQANLITDEGNSVWASLREDSMVVSSADILLKHGLSVAGTWHVLGVLDALPEDGLAAHEQATDFLRLLSLNGTPLGQLFVAIAPLIRQFGRPTFAFGVTPLLVFREVSPAY